MEYIYKGARSSDPKLKGRPCSAVKQANGKCIRGRNGSMLVEFEGGLKCVVIGRLLRKIRSSQGSTL